MKLGLLTAMFGDKPLKEVLETIRPLGLNTVELGTGNYPGDPHAPLQELLALHGAPLLATTLMGYARSNPDRIRGRLMPVIVYDPQAGRRAFSIAMEKLAQ